MYKKLFSIELVNPFLFKGNEKSCFEGKWLKISSSIESLPSTGIVAFIFWSNFRIISSFRSLMIQKNSFMIQKINL